MTHNNQIKKEALRAPIIQGVQWVSLTTLAWRMAAPSYPQTKRGEPAH